KIVFLGKYNLCERRSTESFLFFQSERESPFCQSRACCSESQDREEIIEESNNPLRMDTVFYPVIDRQVCHEYFHMVSGRECIYHHPQGKEYARMKTDEAVYRELYAELERYERKGVDMLLDGYQASPL